MAFASTSDMQNRLGKTFSPTEGSMATYLLDAATSLIAQAADKDDAWAAAYDAPVAIKSLCVEVVARVMSNPNLLQSYDERLGQYELRGSFPTAGIGLLLTEHEELFVRRIVFGVASTSMSIEQDSHATLDYPWLTDLKSLGPDDPAYWLGGQPQP